MCKRTLSSLLVSNFRASLFSVSLQRYTIAICWREKQPRSFLDKKMMWHCKKFSGQFKKQKFSQKFLKSVTTKSVADAKHPHFLLGLKFSIENVREVTYIFTSLFSSSVNIAFVEVSCDFPNYLPAFTITCIKTLSI